MIKHNVSKEGVRHELTKDQFDLFVKEAKYWINFFHLFDYNITYVLRDDDRVRGWCSIGNIEDRIMEIGIASTWNEPPKEWDICYIAFHEAVEALTMRYFLLATDRYSTEQDIREENHVIIHRMQYSVFNQYMEGRKNQLMPKVGRPRKGK